MSGFELQETPSAAGPASKAPVPADPSWAPLEAWVWQKLQAGAIANIDEYHDGQGSLWPAGPENPEDWQDGRRQLSAGFLETILLEQPYRGAIHRRGVRIRTAWFEEKIDLSDSELHGPLWLDRSRFEGEVNLAYVRGRLVSFDGSHLVAKLSLQRADIEANLVMRDGAEFQEIDLRGAKVGGQVSLVGAKVAGKLDMDSADIGQSLFMRSDDRVAEQRAEFNEVVLRSAKVGGQVSLIGARVSGELNMGAADIGQSLLMASDRTMSKQSAEFNEVILRGAKVGGQVSLIGAKVAGTLNMDSVDIGQSLLMASDRTMSKQSAGFNEVILRGAKVGGQVSLIGAKVAGKLNMGAADIGQSLLMASDRTVSKQSAGFNEVILRGIKVGGQVNLVGAKVSGELNMDSADVGQSLLMGSHRIVSAHRAEFNEVVLIGAKVGGQVSLSGAKVAGTLDMDSVDIGRDLVMRSNRSVSAHRAEFNEVVLGGAKVGGQVSLVGGKVVGKLDMDSADIGQRLLMSSDRNVSEHIAEFDAGVRLIFTSIGSSLDLRGAVLSRLDLSGARIGGELALASGLGSPRWQNGGRLVLRNTSVDAIQDTTASGVWPPDLELDGFTYKRFGGLGQEADHSIAQRDPQWFVNWLARDEPYTPQPYQQCATVLREMGHPDMANDVLYEGRERERHEIWTPWPDARGRGLQARLGRTLRWLKTMIVGQHPHGGYDEIRRSFRWLGLSILAFVVGYGYGTRLFWRPLGCAALILAIGIRVTYSDVSAFADCSILWRTFFSLDMLLPIVELSREHSVVQAGLDGLAYGWFVIQRLLGWVLALFLIAGLSGLTK